MQTADLASSLRVPSLSNLFSLFMAGSFVSFLFGVLIAIAIFVVGVIISLAIWNWVLNVPVVRRLAQSIYRKITGRY